ncbi:MAG: GTPase Era [Clostridia bacterium]|nr:GTPase Era [Clostridia bacterium]
MSEAFRSGFVAIVGRPNVGKSTLLNALVGEKVAIVSPKPQTTRNKIAGILNGDGYQIVFEDTPGIFNGKTELAKYMKKAGETALADTDVALVVIDGEKGLLRGDEELLARLKETDTPIIVAVNKRDIAKNDRIVPTLAALGAMSFIDEVLPISAQTGENLDVLKQYLIKYLPEGVPFYGEDELTDKSERFLVAELVREKILLFCNDEIPHGVGVEVDKFTYDEEKGLYDIDAVIVCEKASHKPILIGKGGSQLKKIGAAARKEIEKFLDGKVFLALWVRVKESWRDSESLTRRMGYDKKDI